MKKKRTGGILLCKNISRSFIIIVIKIKREIGFVVRATCDIYRGTQKIKQKCSIRNLQRDVKCLQFMNLNIRQFQLQPRS